MITFVREVEHPRLRGAVEWLAAKAGMVLHYTDASEGEGRKKRHRLVAVMGRAVDWYHERLLSGPDAGAARSYLRPGGSTATSCASTASAGRPTTGTPCSAPCGSTRTTPRDSGLGSATRDRLQDSFRRG